LRIVYFAQEGHWLFHKIAKFHDRRYDGENQFQ
jgi:hypothetical protein